jgi:sentrin-specific protease 1
LKKTNFQVILFYLNYIINLFFLKIINNLFNQKELNEEQESLINQALIPSPQDEVLVEGFSVKLTRRDIQTLRGLNWLNDEIINFYMTLICERSKQSSNNENLNDSTFLKAHAFSTFFYPKLLKDGYSSLKRWTRKIDLFSHDIILIPVHLGLHWTLAVIDMTCKEVRYYDSMNGNNHECLRSLRNYLRDEYADKKNGAQLNLTEWNCLHVKDVPQQMNGSDCGMFTCKYAEYISRGKTEFNFNQVNFKFYIFNLNLS